MGELTVEPAPRYVDLVSFTVAESKPTSYLTLLRVR